MPYVIDLTFKFNGGPINTLLGQMRQLHALSSQPINIGGGGGSRGGGSGFAGGPFQKLAAAHFNLMKAVQSGNWMQRADAVLAYNKALAAAQNAQKQLTGSTNNFAKSLARLLFSTRIGFGVGGGGGGTGGVSFMPLAGQLFKALMPLIESQPEIAAVVAAFVVLTMATIGAAKAAMEFGTSLSKAYFSSGGSLRETGQLAGLGAVLGYSPEQMANMANQYNEALKTNPYARSAAAQNGITPNYIGAYGDIDNAQRLLKGFDMIMHAKSDDQARRMAMGTPLENMLWLLHADKGIQRQYKSVMAEASSTENTRQAVNAQAQLNIAMAKFQMILVTLGNYSLPWINHELDTVIKSIDFWMGVLKKLLNLVGIHTNHTDPIKDAMDNTAKAANNLARALDDTRQTYGGGEYARKSLPGRYFGDMQTGQSWQTSQQRRAIHLGEIPIG